MEWSKRLKNYGLWVSVASLVPIVMQTFGMDVLPDNYEQLTNGVLTVLVFLGIINNPSTDNRWYTDDK